MIALLMGALFTSQVLHLGNGSIFDILRLVPLFAIHWDFRANRGGEKTLQVLHEF